MGRLRDKWQTRAPGTASGPLGTTACLTPRSRMPPTRCPSSNWQQAGAPGSAVCAAPLPPPHLLQLRQLPLQLLVHLGRALGAQRQLHLALLAGHLCGQGGEREGGMLSWGLVVTMDCRPAWLGTTRSPA